MSSRGEVAGPLNCRYRFIKLTISALLNVFITFQHLHLTSCSHVGCSPLLPVLRASLLRRVWIRQRPKHHEYRTLVADWVEVLSSPSESSPRKFDTHVCLGKITVAAVMEAELLCLIRFTASEISKIEWLLVVCWFMLLTKQLPVYHLTVTVKRLY